jgi:hypothetical protein
MLDFIRICEGRAYGDLLKLTFQLLESPSITLGGTTGFPSIPIEGAVHLVCQFDLFDILLWREVVK